MRKAEDISIIIFLGGANVSPMSSGFLLGILLDLKMEAMCFSESLGCFRTTVRIHRCGDLNPRTHHFITFFRSN
jgi:hypothetical protein